MNEQEITTAKSEIIHGFYNLVEMFDFETVKKIMTMMNWTWGLGQKSFIPTESDMKKSALELFNFCIRDFNFEKECTCSSGGFEVSIYDDGTTELKFVAVSGTYDMELQEVMR